MTPRRLLPLASAAALLAVGSLAPTASHAFDMLGFRGGMSLDAFVAQARAGGYAITASGVAGENLPEGAWAGERLLGASLERKDAPRLNAFLCGGRLQSLSEVIDGGLDAFVREVAGAQGRFSAPGTPGKAVSRNLTPKHVLSSLSVGWPDARQGTYRVEVVSASGSSAVHRGWSTRLEGCEEG